jgi:acetolactate synthase-1/2/3 large subunit
MRHEQGAAHAADGYARATGKVGVAFATSGPGTTNLVTGIATAHMDSVPTVFITGQVAREAIGKDAFQETDVTGITLPITKHNYLVMNASEIAETIKEAFYLASTGRPGPVLVDIPKDVFVEKAEFEYPETVNLPNYDMPQGVDPEQVQEAVQLIKEARKPLILAGHGVIISRAYDELIELAEKAQIPVITTLLGISSFPETHPLSIGMPGMHGMAYASLAIDEADLLLGLGMRFDDRITGKLSAFAPNAKVIHVEVDPSEVHKNVRATVPLIGDLKKVLQQLIPAVEPKSHEEWVQRIEELRVEHPPMRPKDTGELRPQYVIQALSQATNGNAVPPRRLSVVRGRRRRFPDDDVRAGNYGREQHSGKVRHFQQPVPGDGAPVAGHLL